MTYVDGFLLPIPKKNLARYRKLARDASKVWMDNGALSYVEAAADDMVNVSPDGTTRPSLFLSLPGLKRTETVVFSFVTYKSKAHRNQVNKRILKDPRMAEMMERAMPFDVGRMAYGGFKAIAEG